MSLGTALSIAASGLTATSRAADLTSQNIANALTDGYSRREINLANRGTGGVAVTGVTRFADQALTADRRVAEAGRAASDAVAGFHTDMEAAIGTDDAAGSLGGLVSALDVALIGAAAQPQSDAALRTAVTAAAVLAQRVNDLGGDVQDARLAADGRIATGVEAINAALKRVEALNTQIAGLTAAGNDVADLQDQRQMLVDGIATQIPLRESTREDGRIALTTASGLTLLDGRAPVLGFSPVRGMAADMTAEGGTLSGLTLNGTPVPAGALGSGALAAEFEIRDALAPAVQQGLDAFAADLTHRLGGAGLIVAGPGGLAVDARLQDDPWRLRDGLLAPAESDAGDATRLNALVSALSAGTGAQGSAAALLSGVSSARLAAESAQSFNAARYDTLRTAELSASGVDTDAEMTNLLVIQQAYTANAKVIQAVDEMMTTILGL